MDKNEIVRRAKELLRQIDYCTQQRAQLACSHGVKRFLEMGNERDVLIEELENLSQDKDLG